MEKAGLLRCSHARELFLVCIVVNVPSPISPFQANFSSFRLELARKTWPENLVFALDLVPSVTILFVSLPCPKPSLKPSPKSFTLAPGPRHIEGRWPRFGCQHFLAKRG